MKIIELGENKVLNGKAGSLNRLFCDFNIAKGFIITNEYFLEYIKFNQILLTDSNNLIKKNIMRGIFPDEDKLLEYFNRSYSTVIVRSSASVEDGRKNSFSGQFSSYSNVTYKDLIYFIKKCWCSQFDDNIYFYYKEKKNNNFSFDVLIQEMIVTDISGIAFSINPINSQKEMVIEVSNAQCEKIVSGKVIPYVFHGLDKNNNKILSNQMISEINQNLNKLKQKLKREIEIEFGFKDEIFYLFQVRPITKVYFSLNDYIKKEVWCCFKNNSWSLFDRSLWILGANKYKCNKINNDVTEDITLCYPKDERQIRGFNGNQPPLDEISVKRFLISDINIYIERYNKVILKINNISKIIENYIKENNYDSINSSLKKLIRYNAIINSYEYLIGSLGQVFYNQLDKAALTAIEKWRNSEDSYFYIYNLIFNYVVNYFELSIDGKFLRRFIHANELIKLFDKKLLPDTLMKRVNKRYKYGFVLLNLNYKKYNNKVITNDKTIEVVKSRFNILEKEIMHENRFDGVKGSSVFKNGKVIKGECIVVDKSIDLSMINTNNKILICPVTTAKDVKYLQNVKAIIADNGGVLCHSAIFSREFGIPCLMGCGVACEYFKTGDKVIYDIDNEIVKKIE